MGSGAIGGSAAPKVHEPDAKRSGAGSDQGSGESGGIQYHETVRGGGGSGSWAPIAGREYQNGRSGVASNELLDEYDETRVVVFCEARIMPRSEMCRVTGRR